MRVLLRFFIGIFTITLFAIFGAYYLCSIYLNSYQINNNIKIFYDMKNDYEISVANKNWPVSNYILEELKKKNPNSIEKYRLNIIDFYYVVISGLFEEKLLVDENQREQELILLERKIPLENRS